MMQTTIRHCPNCPSLQSYLEDVAASLTMQNVEIQWKDGKSGEFTVIVNGKTVLKNQVDDLPAVADVWQAVQREQAVGRFAKPHTWI